ncbi:MAG: hypothetical protein IKZ55_07375 [Bacteroidales bacterium]|nr:hypothetical protein [Bacteroidales bacterium]
MDMKHSHRLIATFVILGFAVFTSCSSDINSNYDPHFTEDGYRIINDSTVTPAPLTQVKFFVEVSGSMNGFFRANQPTDFKKDVWQILSYFSPLAPEGVTILTNNGDEENTYDLSKFQTMMNTGAFVSSASTKVPLMLQTIVSKLDADHGEVAVLISDMKYSPVGAAAPKVLLTQYSTDVSKIFGQYEKAISLVCATSNYLDKKGNSVCDVSPYYFLIIGNETCVAEMRDGISTLLNNNHRFVDNIESGFNYGRIKESFGIPKNCFQMDLQEPTFVAYEEADTYDTCNIYLKVDLTPYRWIMTDKDYFTRAFKAKTLYGSTLVVDDVNIDVQNITDRQLKRTAVATVRLKVFNMPTDSDVIEWTMELPDGDYTLFGPFCGATTEEDVSKSYSIEDFLVGMFYGGVVNSTLEPNYILVSKNS